MTTTAPIAGNQYFSQVFDQAGHLNLLNVSNLMIGTATTNSLEVVASNPDLGLGQDPSTVRTLLDGFGHILLSQKTEPTITLGGFNAGTSVELISATDTAGEILITNATWPTPPSFELKFNRPYPLETRPAVILTPGSTGAAFIQSSAKNGWFVENGPVANTGESFKVFFNGNDPGLKNYAIKYQVVCPTPHS
jgi:hypothetical protein